MAQETRSSAGLQPDCHFLELSESSSGQIIPMSILIFHRARRERLEKSYVHSSIHPLSLTPQPQPTEITGCFMLSFHLLLQDRWILEAFSTPVGQEARTCAHTHAHTHRHTPITCLLTLHGLLENHNTFFYSESSSDYGNILHDTSETKICCYLNFLVDISTDFSAYGLGPYLTLAPALFPSLAVPESSESHFPR